jgi:hypothetical protein
VCVCEKKQTVGVARLRIETKRANYVNTYVIVLRLPIKIYRTIILPVVVYGCETWSLTLREERRLRVFENRVLRRVFGPKRDEEQGNGENYIMRSLVICTPYPILCGW